MVRWLSFALLCCYLQLVLATEALVTSWVTLQAPTFEFVGSSSQTIHHGIIPRNPCPWVSYLALHRDKHNVAHRRVFVPTFPSLLRHLITRPCANTGTAFAPIEKGRIVIGKIPLPGDWDRVFRFSFKKNTPMNTAGVGQACRL